MTNPITFYYEMTGLVDEGRALELVCFQFRKAFDLASLWKS